MIKTTHIESSDDPRGIVEKLKAEEALKTSHRDSAEEAMKFYLSSPEYTEVYIVKCNSCKADMCLEVLNPREAPAYMQVHHQGRRRVTLGNDKMLSHRKRLDGVMGYKCICGNNTINSQVELGILPTVVNPSSQLAIPNIEPHHIAQVSMEIARKGWKPDVEVTGTTTRIESFTVERLK